MYYDTVFYIFSSLCTNKSRLQANSPEQRRCLPRTEPGNQTIGLTSYHIVDPWGRQYFLRKTVMRLDYILVTDKCCARDPLYPKQDFWILSSNDFFTFGVEGYEITLTRVIWFALEHRATSVNFGLTRICCGSSNQEPESWMIKWSINMQILSKVIKSIDDVGRQQGWFGSSRHSYYSNIHTILYVVVACKQQLL